MARYQLVEWHHGFQDEPVLLYSEIDDQGIETRKVDEYRDGHLDYAEEGRSTGTTFLSEKRMPNLDDIAAQADFTAHTISKDQFEEVWGRATGQA